MGEILSSQSGSILTKGYTKNSDGYNNAVYYWTIAQYKGTEDFNHNNWLIHSDGDFTDFGSPYCALRPVIVIKSEVEIIGGNGIWSNPYQI